MMNQQFYPFPVYAPPPQEPPANQNYKMAAIMLFVTGFGLKVLGFIFLAVFIGLIPLVMGVGCDIIAFIFLCLI